MESLNQEIVIDDTEYLRASQAMIARLEKAEEQEKNNERVTITLDEIWNENHWKDDNMQF